MGLWKTTQPIPNDMKSKELLQRYKAGERNFENIDLSGQYFKDQDLSGANFKRSGYSGNKLQQSNTNQRKFQSG